MLYHRAASQPWQIILCVSYSGITQLSERLSPINLGDFQYFSNIIVIFYSSPSEIRIVLTIILLEVMVYWLDSVLRTVSVSSSADDFICGGFS